MLTVWKYPLPDPGIDLIEMPANSRFLHAALQDGKPFMWVLVDDTYSGVAYRVAVCETGAALPDVIRCMVYGGMLASTRASRPYVLHVFVDGFLTDRTMRQEQPPR